MGIGRDVIAELNDIRSTFMSKYANLFIISS